MLHFIFLPTTAPTHKNGSTLMCRTIFHFFVEEARQLSIYFPKLAAKFVCDLALSPLARLVFVRSPRNVERQDPNKQERDGKCADQHYRCTDTGFG